MKINRNKKVLSILFSVLILFASSITLLQKDGIAKAAGTAPQNVTITNASGTSVSNVNINDQITVSGIYTANTFVSIKMVDSGNIAFYDAVKSGTDGKFSDTFKVPNVTGKSVTLVVGSGTDVVDLTLSIGQVTPVSVTGVTLDKSSNSLAAGGTFKLTATVSPDNATNKTVSWISSNPSVATVDQTGNVTAVAAGNAIITATTADGSKTAQCPITVTAANANPVSVTELNLDKNSAKVELGKSITIGAKVLPENATNKNVTWSSSDKNIATVDASGKVTGVKEGTVTITATTQDGNISKECKVTVAIDECFIATAAYGSKFQPSVVLLRHFRDDYLLTNQLGKDFVKFYYKHSPPIANFIAHNVILKNTVKALLTPFVAVVYGLYHPATMFAALGLISLIILARKKQLGYSKL